MAEEKPAGDLAPEITDEVPEQLPPIATEPIHEALLASSKTSIDTAGEYLGCDFLELIGRVGGKNAGNEVIKAIHERKGGELAEIVKSGGFKRITVPETHYVDMDFYRRFEGLVPDWNAWMTKHRGSIEGPAHKKRISYDLAKILLKESEEARALFTELLDSSAKRFSGQDKLLFRGSTLSEDFINDQYAGVSPSDDLDVTDTGGYSIARLCNIYMYIIACKYFPETEYVEFSKEETLALQVVPEIDWEWHITSHCDADDNVTLQIIDKRLLYRNKPIWLNFVINTEDDIKVVPSFSDDNEEAVLIAKICDKDIGGVPSFLKKKEVLALAKLARHKRAEVGMKTLETEALMKEGTLYDVQLRPMMEIYGDLDESEAPREENIIAKSPFVLGKRFSVTGKLLFINSMIELGFFLDGVGWDTFPLEEYIIVFNAEDYMWITILRTMVRRGKKPAGFIGTKYGSELSHQVGNDTTGYTYYFRNNTNYISGPHLGPALKAQSFQIVNLEEQLVGKGNEIDEGITATEEVVHLYCEGKEGIIARVD